MREADNLPRPPNPAEIALLCDMAATAQTYGANGHKHPDFSYGNVKSTRKSRQMYTRRVRLIVVSVAKRRNERRHIQRIREIIQGQFIRGAFQAMGITEEDDSDDATDRDENQETLLEE